jgi:lysophospholipase L1-like esterase
MTELDSRGNGTSRRRFLGDAATAIAAVTASSLLSTSGCATASKQSAGASAGGLLGKGNVILFQGDSITDMGRNKSRENNANDAGAMGTGYVLLTASEILARRHDPQLKIYNRGISGNKVYQLAERWDKDCLSLKPDLLSILIGVNDLWHKLNGQYNGTVEIYERDYRALLERTRKELPQVELVICEPFVLRCGSVTDKWFPEFDGYRAAAKRVATSFDAAFVPFQSVFDKAVKSAPPAYWAADGVHPTMAGAWLMARAWLDIVSNAGRKG